MTKTMLNTRVSAAVFMLFILAILSACDEQSDQQKNNQKNNQDVVVQASKPSNQYVILALGDSLTEGLGVKQNGNYPALLEAALHQQGHKHIKVVNSGLSGETSSGLKNRLDWVLQLKPDLTVLNIGANDAMRGLPLELTTNNINDIIKRIKANGSDVILAGMQIYDNLGREYVVGFKDMYPQLAAEHNLTMIPFFLAHVAGNPSLNQADMIHPTTAGYEVIVNKNILPVILTQLADVPKNSEHP